MAMVSTRLLCLHGVSAFLPAGKIKDGAVRADPGIGSVADLHVGQISSRVCMLVDHDIVDSYHSAETDHPYI